jgi:broad specificity phosphatase PhoE
MSDKAITTIYVVRHGESQFNVSPDFNTIESHGDLGAALTENGKLQAKALVEKLKNVKLAAIFSSDLTRAKQTAEFIALERKIAVETTQAIRERDIVFYAYKKGFKNLEEIEETLKKELAELSEEEKMDYKHEDSMESVNEGATRLLTFIREAAVAYAGQTIMVVCHGNIMRCLLSHLGFAKFDELTRKSVENTAYFVLESDGIDFFIKETSGIKKMQGEIRPF